MAAIPEAKSLFLDPDLAQPLHRMVWTSQTREEPLPGLRRAGRASGSSPAQMHHVPARASHVSCRPFLRVREQIGANACLSSIPWLRP